MSFDTEKHLHEVKLLRLVLKAMIIEAGQPADFSFNRPETDSWKDIISRTASITDIRLETSETTRVNFDFCGLYCRQALTVMLSTEEIETRVDRLMDR